jgi:hypothetical protein
MDTAYADEDSYWPKLVAVGFFDELMHITGCKLATWRYLKIPV